MQLVGFPKIDTSLFFDRREFDGITVAARNGVTLNAATCPRIGFGELNIVPKENFDVNTLADFIKVSVDYLLNHFSVYCKSYNIFFYDNGNHGEKFLIKLLPRFATSPLFIGYNIHFLPNNLGVIVSEMQERYGEIFAR